MADCDLVSPALLGSVRAGTAVSAVTEYVRYRQTVLSRVPSAQSAPATVSTGALGNGEPEMQAASRQLRRTVMVFCVSVHRALPLQWRVELPAFLPTRL